MAPSRRNSTATTLRASWKGVQGLATGKVKICKLCQAKSTDRSPLTLGVGIQAKWGSLIPWGHGTPDKPVGRYDLICVRTFHTGSFEAEFGPITNYNTEVGRHPERHSRFLAARLVWINHYNENPLSKLSERAMMDGARVERRNSERDELEAPEEELIELNAWQTEMLQKLPAGSPKPLPEHYGLKEVCEMFRGVKMRGVNVLIGKVGHYKRRRTDGTSVERTQMLETGEHQLEDGQSDNTFQAARGACWSRQQDTAVSMEDVMRVLTGSTGSMGTTTRGSRLSSTSAWSWNAARMRTLGPTRSSSSAPGSSIVRHTALNQPLGRLQRTRPAQR